MDDIDDVEDHSFRNPRVPCPHDASGSGRNLILCIDGTANQFGEKNTNVIELYNLILKDARFGQRTWYNSGVGTYARPHWRSFKYYQQVVFHKIDLAIAWNFEKTIQAAYRWLSDNYRDGDCIFLFGFSRGAFQVRTLSAMIEKVGLIYRGNETQIPFAYELYVDSGSDKTRAQPIGSTNAQSSEPAASAGPPHGSASLMSRLKKAFPFVFGSEKSVSRGQSDASAGRLQDTVSMAERFKRAFSQKNVRVHFVGAWDTVSSVGVARGKKTLPGTTEGMTHVCYFRHALALDERRVKFLPEYAWGGSALPPPDIGFPLDAFISNRNRQRPHTLEVWFPGTHSDIGGGNMQNVGMDRSRPPLRWMAQEAASVGLRIQGFERELQSNEQIEFKESLTGFWHLLEYIPFRRLTFEGTKDLTRIPHRGSGRKVQKGQRIHSSFVLAQTGTPYIPKASPPDNNRSFWEDLRKDGIENSSLLEIDMFDYATARRITRMFIYEDEKLEYLRRMVAEGTGAQALYDEVSQTLVDWDDHQPSVEDRYKLLRRTIDLLQEGSPKLQLVPRLRIHHLFADLQTSARDDYKEAADAFLRQFADGSSPLVLMGHTGYVLSAGFSPDSKRIFSTSVDGTIRLWDTKTGAQIGVLGSLTLSVAVLPDGKRIVSGEADGTVRIRDAGTGSQLGEPLIGHTGPVRCLVVSPDGRRIVSGSLDKTVRIWDAETGARVGEPLHGHNHWVCSAAISPDGKYIVSGSKDKIIRIWDLEKGEQVGDPLQGHTRSVMSLAISPDGKRLVSGSNDCTIRIWDLETGAQVGEPLKGHADKVVSVALSPDGNRIVSGSRDSTIRIWDLRTGAQVGDPLQQHMDEVNSVSISPDGKRIASASDDYTIRIWNAEGILL